MGKPNMFFGVSPTVAGTGTTWSVALATTNTGATLSNPAVSATPSYDLHLVRATFVCSAVPVAIAAIGLFTGFAAAGVTVHTTAGVVQVANRIGDTATAVGKFDLACTLVGTPRWSQIMGVMPVVATPFDNLWEAFDVKYELGEIVVPPGGYVGIGASTAVVGYASMFWVEVQRPRL